MRLICLKLLMLVLLAYQHPAFALLNPELSLQGQAAQLRNIEADANGFLRNLGSDGYLVFDNLNLRRDQACGLMLDAEFASPMQRPGLFELFWYSSTGGFSEKTKAFVLLNQRDSVQRNTYVIPLCKLYHYSGNMNLPTGQQLIKGLRLDYPSNKDIAIKFHSVRLLNAADTAEVLAKPPEDVVILEPYERLHPNAFTSLDVIVPKLFFILEEGLHRLWVDKGFLVFWLLSIIALKLMMLRSFMRK